MNVNQCDLRCPKTLLMGMRLQRNMQQPKSPLTLAATLVGTGVRGVGQAMRAAARCPSRGLSAHEWHPSDECIRRAQELADELQLRRAELPAKQSAILGCVHLADDPPAVSPQ